jgi:hypothetical protein
MSASNVLLAALLGLIPTALAVAVYLTKHRTRHLKLRYLYERLCICLDQDQLEEKRTNTETPAHSRLPEQATYLTAIEFLDESGGNGRRLMSQLDRFSPSLFAASMMKLIAFSLFLSLVALIISLFLIASSMDKKTLEDADPVLILLLGGGLGTIVSFGAVLFVYKVNFDKSLEDVRLIAERWAIWDVGANSRPKGRTVIMAKDDPDFVGLFGNPA